MKTTLITLIALACLNTAFGQEFIADGSNPGRNNTVTIKKNEARPATAKGSLNNFAPATIVDTTRRVEDLVVNRYVGSKSGDADRGVQLTATNKPGNTEPASKEVSAPEARTEKASSNRNYTKAEVSKESTISSDLTTSEYKSLIKESNNLLKTDAKNEEAYMTRAIASAELNKLNNAIMDFNEVILLNPTNVKAYYNRGLAKMLLGDYQGGINDMTRVIRLNPGDVDAYFNRAQCKVYLDKSMEAIEDLTVVIKLDPGNTEAYLNRGSLKYDLQDLHGACRDWSAIANTDKQAAKNMKRFCID